LALQVPTEVPKGAIILGVIVEGNPPSVPATKSNLDSWITAARAPNTWMLDSVDPQPKMEDFFTTGRDYYVIFNPRTMKIVDQGFGSDPMGALAAMDAVCNQ
jgi:hypothetical protein